MYNIWLLISTKECEAIVTHRVRDMGREGAGAGGASASAGLASGVALADASSGAASGGQSQRRWEARARTRPHQSGPRASRSLRRSPSSLSPLPLR